MGAVTLSVDAELGWGWHDLDTPPVERVEAGREGWRALLAMFETYDVPATWAIVGHLLLDRCDGSHTHHPAGPEWFERERTEWRHRPRLRFADGLFDALCRSPVDHDIGCHTFSHVPFGAAETDRETARAELAASLSVAARHGLAPESFVFPRNRVGHREVLSEAGLTVYRGPRPTVGLDRLGDGVGKLTRTVAPSLAPPVVEPRVDEYGLVNVPASLYLFGFEGVPRDVVTSVQEDPIVRLARRGVDRVADSDGVFHMWLHPNNLVDRQARERVRRILAHVATRRNAGDVSVETMAGLAQRVRDDH